MSYISTRPGPPALLSPEPIAPVSYIHLSIINPQGYGFGVSHKTWIYGAAGNYRLLWSPSLISPCHTHGCMIYWHLLSRFSLQFTSSSLIISSTCLSCVNLFTWHLTFHSGLVNFDTINDLPNSWGKIGELMLITTWLYGLCTQYLFVNMHFISQLFFNKLSLTGFLQCVGITRTNK